MLVPTGTANVASVSAALRRLGAEPTIAQDPSDVDRSERVVLPGVGSFGAAMARVDLLDLRQAILRRLRDGRPTLAICVGMQLLAAASQESTGVAGLGVLDSEVSRFPGTVRVPQIGWNRVRAGVSCRFVTSGWAYFANSFRIVETPDGWSAATADYGGPFVAALERGDVLACQFHPELSGRWGTSVLASWLESGGG